MVGFSKISFRFWMYLENGNSPRTTKITTIQHLILESFSLQPKRLQKDKPRQEEKQSFSLRISPKSWRICPLICLRACSPTCTRDIRSGISWNKKPLVKSWAQKNLIWLRNEIRRIFFLGRLKKSKMKGLAVLFLL